MGFNIDKYFTDLQTFIIAKPEKEALEECLLPSKMVNDMIPTAQCKTYKCSNIPESLFTYFPFLTKTNGINMSVNFTNSLRHCNIKKPGSSIATKTLIFSPSVMFFTDNGYYFPFEFHFSIDTKSVFPNAARIFNEVITEYPNNTSKSSKNIIYILDYFFYRLKPYNLLEIIADNHKTVIPFSIMQTIVGLSLSTSPLESLHIDYKRYGSISNRTSHPVHRIRLIPNTDTFTGNFNIGADIVCKLADMQLLHNDSLPVKILVPNVDGNLLVRSNKMLKEYFDSQMSIIVQKSLLNITFSYIQTIHSFEKYRNIIQSGQLDFVLPFSNTVKEETQMNNDISTTGIENMLKEIHLTQKDSLFSQTSDFMSLAKDKLFQTTQFKFIFNMKFNKDFVVGVSLSDKNKSELLNSAILSMNGSVTGKESKNGILCYIPNNIENLNSLLPIKNSKQKIDLHTTPVNVYTRDASDIHSLNSYQELICSINGEEYLFEELKKKGFMLIILSGDVTLNSACSARFITSKETFVTIFSNKPHLDLFKIGNFIDTMVQSIEVGFELSPSENLQYSINDMSLSRHNILSLKR